MYIRQATLEDIPIVSKLAREIWPSAFQSVLTKEQIKNLVEKIYHPESLKDEIENQGHVFWILYHNENPAAYASAYTDPKTIWLKKIYVHPELQGKGYGSKLMEVVINQFPDYCNLSLFVNRDNLAAQEFYTRKGFVTIAQKSVRMGDFNFIDLIMVKKVREAFVINSSEDFDNFANEFQNCTLPKNKWTHEAHFVIALWLILRHGLEAAKSLARDGIKKYNEATGVANTELNGYHETITMLYLTAVNNFVKDFDTNDEINILSALLKSEIIAREYPLQFYTAQVLFSKEARLNWVQPDLVEL